jgi:hypothetical protein
VVAVKVGWGVFVDVVKGVVAGVEVGLEVEEGCGVTVKVG